MKKLLLPLMTLLLIFSCDTSTVFKTTLPYLKETTSSFPEAINGTYFFMNDSLKTAFLNSGLPAPQFIENLCNIDSTEYAHFAHSISISEDRRQLYNTLLVLITEKVLNLNYFLDDKDTVRWRKIHEHLMELQMKNEASETDTTYLLPIWKKEGLYFTNYFSLENDKTSDKYEGYILRNEFDRSPEESQSDNAIKPAIVKSYNDQYYLIEQQDSLYRITQYALSPWGFTKSIIPPINLPSENTDSSGKLETSIVDSIQKTSRVSQIGDQIVFDPQKEELERLFKSNWAKKEYYIRIDQRIDDTTSYLKENGLTALLSILCLVLLILLLLKKSPKKMA